VVPAGRADAVPKLAVVFSLIVETQRLDDEPVSADRPFLEAGDAHSLARIRARAGERPVVFDRVLFEDELVIASARP
jgi:hypothetical protein